MNPDRCPLCDRELLSDSSVNEHHPIPRSRGGKEKVRMHVVCHSKIHSLFTEKELARTYHDFELLKAHPEMQGFLTWIRKKPPGYRSRNKTSRKKGRRG